LFIGHILREQTHNNILKLAQKTRLDLRFAAAT